MYVEKLLNGLRRLERPRFMASHRVTGIRGLDGAREWTEPDMVCGHGQHTIERGRVNNIREIPEAYAADLRAIDARRAELNAELAKLRKDEAEVLQLAYQASRPVSVADVKAMQQKPEDSPC